MTDTMELPTINGETPDFPPPEPPTPGTKTGDPLAPYGYTASGAPRRPPGRKPSAAKSSTAPPPPKPKPAKATPPKTSAKTDYRPGIIDLGEGIAALTALEGVRRNKPILIVDAATIDMGLPHVAEVGNAAADKFPIVANILDKLLVVGPHATAVGGVMVMVAQLLVNHGLLPAGLIPGTVAPDQLATAYMGKLAVKYPHGTAAAADSFAATTS